jgi:hypothetical protein
MMVAVSFPMITVLPIFFWKDFFSVSSKKFTPRRKKSQTAIPITNIFETFIACCFDAAEETRMKARLLLGWARGVNQALLRRQYTPPRARTSI